MVAPNDPTPQPPKRIRFLLGNRSATPGALEAIDAAGESVLKLFERHQSGDWGVVCDADALLNEEAIRDGDRILSAYMLSTGVKVWVLTESDRSVTTILLPDEY